MRALVVEGGGMRAAWSAGVLDHFAEQGHMEFDIHVGVSAGALLLVNHIAGQRRRSIEIMCDPRFTGAFGNLGRFITGGDYLDIEAMWAAGEEIRKLDTSRFFNQLNARDIQMLICATDVDNGAPIAVKPTPENLREALLASSALPMVVRNPVLVDGIPCLDGGITNPLPVDVALEAGANEVLLIRSRPEGFVKKTGLERFMARTTFRKNPAMKDALRARTPLYLETEKMIAEDERIVELRPSVPLRSSRTCTDPVMIRLDYLQGIEDARKFLRTVRSTV